MASVNERLRDASIDHALDLAQYSEYVARRMVGLLNRVDADLADELRKALERLPASSFTVERLERLLGAVRELNTAVYDRIAAAMTETVGEFAGVEAEFQGGLLARVVPEPVQVHLPIAEVTAEQVRTAALTRPFQGRLLRDWYKKLPADRMDVLRNAVRLGYVQGETVKQIVDRVVGTPAARKQDGAFQRARRDLEAVTHTAINHVAAAARDRFFEANDDLIESITWSSVIDLHTSSWCIARSEKRYTVKTHKPIGHTIAWLGGPGRIHYRCRAAGVPNLKSAAALGLDKLPPRVKASMDGVIPAETSLPEWIGKQSQERQEQVLGQRRARLVREGGLSVEDLYDRRGQWLTLDTLKERNAAAFERARL
jgi:hypothetical protein